MEPDDRGASTESFPPHGPDQICYYCPLHNGKFHRRGNANSSCSFTLCLQMQNIRTVQANKKDLVDLTLSRSRLTEADLGASRLHVSYLKLASLHMLLTRHTVPTVSDWVTCPSVFATDPCSRARKGSVAAMTLFQEPKVRRCDLFYLHASSTHLPVGQDVIEYGLELKKLHFAHGKLIVHMMANLDTVKKHSRLNVTNFRLNGTPFRLNGTPSRLNGTHLISIYN